MTPQDLVFKALADGTRRLLLDALHEQNGRSLSALEEVVAGHTDMSRFGVAKHLKVLEGADLVIVRKHGRQKLHYLNPVPIRVIYERWINKYTESQVRTLTDLKKKAEKDHE